MRVDTPKSRKTTYHRDGTATFWDCLSQSWQRTGRPSDAQLAALSEPERARIRRHTQC